MSVFKLLVKSVVSSVKSANERKNIDYLSGKKNLKKKQITNLRFFHRIIFETER